MVNNELVNFSISQLANSELPKHRKITCCDISNIP